VARGSQFRSVLDHDLTFRVDEHVTALHHRL